MVADAEELAADQPDRPGSQIGDAAVATRGNSSMRARVAAGLLGLAALFGFGGSTDPIGLIAGQDGS